MNKGLLARVKLHNENGEFETTGYLLLTEQHLAKIIRLKADVEKIQHDRDDLQWLRVFTILGNCISVDAITDESFEEDDRNYIITQNSTETIQPELTLVKAGLGSIDFQVLHGKEMITLIFDGFTWAEVDKLIMKVNSP